MYLYREGYSSVQKAIGIDTYRHIIGISRDQKSPGLRDIDTLSGGVCGAGSSNVQFPKVTLEVRIHLEILSSFNNSS